MNFLVLCIAFGFFILQNNYFGRNTSPKFDAELVADGISFILFAMAFQE